MITATERPTGERGPRRRIGTRRQTVLLILALAVPFVVAAVVLSQRTWYPPDDFALTEMRLRDVTSTDPPLVGLSGRIEHDGVSGSHPGPMSFYLLAPAYRVLGSSGWALSVAGMVLTFAAVVAAVLIGRRRGGTIGALAAGAGLAVLLAAYGTERWTVPWNPNLPLLWWPVVVLAAWSVAGRDWAMLPVLAFAGSLCAQTHLPYLGLAGGMGVFAVVWAAVAARSARRSSDDDPDATEPPAEAATEPAVPGSGRSLVGRWAALAAAIVVVAWLPPVIEQITEDPGNASIIAGQFLDGEEPPAGLEIARGVVSTRLDPLHVVTAADDTNAQSVAGLAFVAAWVAAAGASLVRRRALPADLLRLHATVGAATALGFVAISRVQGPVHPYLTMWLWGTAVLMAAALVWTVAALWLAARPEPASPVTARIGAAALVGLTVAAVVVACVDASDPRPAAETARQSLYAEMFPAGFAALASGSVPGYDRDDRYLVASHDSYTGSMSGFTVLNEAERRGFDAGLPSEFAVSIRDSRVIDPDDASAVLTLASGGSIDEMRATPGAVEIAYADISPAAQAAARAARAEAAEALEEAGRPRLVRELDANVLGLALSGDVPAAAADPIRRLVEIGGPMALFVSPAPAA